MAGRRGWGEDSVYFDHSGECRDQDNHRHCPGRWRGVVSLKSGPDGKRRRKKVSGRNKTEVRAKLAELHDELNDGVVSAAGYTVAQCVEDWLTEGLSGRAPKPSAPSAGAGPAHRHHQEDPAPGADGSRGPVGAGEAGQTRASRTVAMSHAGLTRAIRHAEALGKVRRNVASLIDTPAGKAGRPSHSLNFAQTVALIKAAEQYRLYAYVVLSVLVGVRTEEARSLRWDHVDLKGDPDAHPPVPRTWTCGAPCAREGTPRRGSRGGRWRCRRWPWKSSEHRAPGEDRLPSDDLWHETGLVFTTALGHAARRGNVRRSLRTMCRKSGRGEDWTPRELRHTFVSLLSDNGMALERSPACAPQLDHRDRDRVPSSAPASDPVRCRGHGQDLWRPRTVTAWRV